MKQMLCSWLVMSARLKNIHRLLTAVLRRPGESVTWPPLCRNARLAVVPKLPCRQDMPHHHECSQDILQADGMLFSDKWHT
jgi:hypothetical protein